MMGWHVVRARYDAGRTLYAPRCVLALAIGPSGRVGPPVGLKHLAGIERPVGPRDISRLGTDSELRLALPLQLADNHFPHLGEYFD